MIASAPPPRPDAGAHALDTGSARADRGRSALSPHQAFADLLRPASARTGDEMFARAFDECGLLGTITPAGGEQDGGATQSATMPADPRADGARSAFFAETERATPARTGPPLLSSSTEARAHHATSEHAGLKPSQAIASARSATMATALQNSIIDQTVSGNNDASETASSSAFRGSQAAALARSNAVFVALVQTELGARVLARVSALGAEDRTKLRAEIARLMSRHGLSATIDIETTEQPRRHDTGRQTS
jgi:hypothetical protein